MLKKAYYNLSLLAEVNRQLKTHILSTIRPRYKEKAFQNYDYKLIITLN